MHLERTHKQGSQTTDVPRAAPHRSARASLLSRSAASRSKRGGATQRATSRETEPWSGT